MKVPPSENAQLRYIKLSTMGCRVDPIWGSSWANFDLLQVVTLVRPSFAMHWLKQVWKSVIRHIVYIMMYIVSGSL
jgi:hypothetical protein